MVVPLLLLCTVQLAYATHNLSFVVSVGDRFDFSCSYAGEFGEFKEEGIYMQIDRVPRISDSVESILDCAMRSEAEIFFANGSAGYISYYVLDPQCIRLYESGGVGGSGALAYIPRCIPLGNISYIGELLSSFNTNALGYTTTILMSENYWGFELEGENHKTSSFPYSNFTVSVNIHADYTIEDGFLAHYAANVVNLTSGTNYQYVSMNRLGLAPEVMNIVDVYTYGSPTTVTNVNPDELLSSDLLITTLNLVSIGTWIVVIVVLSIDYRRRR